ncbi:MAG: BrnA antitoxin family protein [Rhodoferax sp.]|nr:BrnA antitoxin family protein [Rhodoferax sp.]
MKPNATSKPLFSAAQMQAALAAAPAGVAGQRGSWAQAVATQGGGADATLAQLRRARGPQKAPTKVPTTIRFDADVLAALKSGGKGWQTRVNDAMRDWLKQHKALTGTTGVAVGR